jgi:hypothetical protein
MQDCTPLPIPSEPPATQSTRFFENRNRLQHIVARAGRHRCDASQLGGGFEVPLADLRPNAPQSITAKAMRSAPALYLRPHTRDVPAAERSVDVVQDRFPMYTFRIHF